MLTLKKLGWLWTVHLNKPVLIHNTTDCNGLYYVHKSPENGFWPIRAFWKWSSEREKAEQCFYSKHCWWLQMKRKEWEVWTVSLLKLRAKFVLQPIFFFTFIKKQQKKPHKLGLYFYARLIWQPVPFVGLCFWHNRNIGVTLYIAQGWRVKFVLNEWAAKQHVV